MNVKKVVHEYDNKCVPVLGHQLYIYSDLARLGHMYPLLSMLPTNEQNYLQIRKISSG